MPAASSKRTTPARKKAKVVQEQAEASTPDSLETPTPPIEADDDDDDDEDFVPSTPPSKGKATPSSSRTKAKRNASARMGKSSLPTDGPTDVPALDTPAKTTPVRPPRSPKGKGKAKLEDDDYEDDDEELFYGKNPDLEIFTQEGPLSTLNRAQLKTQKPRSLRPLWLQGVYHPPFFGIPPTDLASSVSNEDADSQPAEIRNGRSVAKALPWPDDGHARTKLDSNAYPLIKKDLMSFWYGQVGYVPHEGIYDWGWFPGKPVGWAQSIERSKWAQEARKSGATSELVAQGQRSGWPFIRPWLDTQFQTPTILSSKDAQPFLQDTTTPQRSALRHPTTVMKLAVPELTMRNRLKRSVIRDTPKSLKKTARAKAGASGGADADLGAENDDDAAAAAAAADEGEDTIAALDANQEPINLDDPKFANIPNLGFEEKGPVCGDVLHVSVGPPDQEVPVQIAKGTSKRLDSLGVVPDEGHLLNAGGHVYALDWVPVPVHLNTGKEYFVVSAAASKAPLTMIGQKQARPVPASLQIWSVAPDSPVASSSAATSGEKDKGEARLEMVLCHEAGAAFKLAWCPIGHDFVDSKEGDTPRRLGLLAGCFADGSLSVFSVPHPDFVRGKGSKNPPQGPMHIRLDPILRLEHPQQAATSLAWAGGELLAFGGSHGWIGVWNAGQILRSPHPPLPPPPKYVVRAHRSSITDLTFILSPPLDPNGIARTSASPTTLFTVSLDGWTSIIDLVRATSTPIERTRAVHYAVCFSPFSGGSLVHENADGSVTHYSTRAEEMLRSRLISHTPSRVVSMSASGCHPMIAMGSAHGELKVANVLRTMRRTQRIHVAVYQLVVDRSTGALTVRHHVKPEVATLAEGKMWHLGQWHPCLAVTAARWNGNLGRGRLVLSGTACGMVKVDFVKPPYEGLS
ncbi:hypothetical protein [Sporisorium scitamineum]|uniref:Uncharacterized protein n=1 Tax=Sporisorium scitamineum TaxID=49012 RepID=A0A0F7SCH4_9BASI|nr:hypothetical protein [Sporisorium scitamineum]